MAAEKEEEIKFTLSEYEPFFEEYIKVFDSNAKGFEEIEEAEALLMKKQVVFGIDTGRRACQVTRGTGDTPWEGVSYLYPGDKNPKTYSMDDLPMKLRKLVESLMDFFKQQTGVACNNVLIQLYDSMAGIGEHADNTENLNKVGAGGWILSYNGGAHRIFKIRDHYERRMPVELKEGSVVMFSDGNRKHELVKPYYATKQRLRECQTEANPSRCVVTRDLFSCEICDNEQQQRSEKSIHRCNCPHKRLNITLRFLELIEQEETTSKGLKRKRTSAAVVEKKQK